MAQPCLNARVNLKTRKRTYIVYLYSLKSGMSEKYSGDSLEDIEICERNNFGLNEDYWIDAGSCKGTRLQ